MPLRPFAIAATLVGSLVFTSAFAAPAKLAAPPAVATFDLADVRLGSGPFHDAMERDRVYLLSLDPDRLLHTFRLNVGLPTSAQPYGGWESPDVELRGHSLGHYLSACALMYRTTGDAAFKQRVDTIIAALAQCQAESPKAGFHEGYLSAFPESFIDRVEAQKPVWAPWYTLHKILAGLIDSYRLADNAQALDVAQRMAEWIKLRVDHLSREQMQGTLKNEFGGMNDALANLYVITGNPDHLRLAQAFDHALIFDPLAAGEDKLDGFHANTQIPKVIGAAREFEITGDSRYRKIAETFWDRVALHRSYVIGGDSDREHFFPVNEFGRHLSPETTETCNTYNMLKLTRELFALQPDAGRMDFYERGLYNHILASQDPAQGMFVYLMSLAPGFYKVYSTAENSFWCCVGTGMENHAKYGEAIFAHTADALYVNLFIAAEVNWRERHVKISQETKFPTADTTRLVWHAEAPAELALRIRHPGWAAGQLTITINGEPARIDSRPGTYAELKRTWRDGDVVEVKLPMTLHSEELPGTPGTIALLYGPLVLAGKLGSLDMPSAYARDQVPPTRYPFPNAPELVTSDNPLAHVEMISRDPLLFRTKGLARPSDVVLAPFYAVHHERYTVYWNVRTPEAWKVEQDKIAAVEKAWADAKAHATDVVVPGDVASEFAHHLVEKNSESGKIGANGWRIAQKDGVFSYELATCDARSLTLVCAYGSQDRARRFSVFVNDQKVATPKLDGLEQGQFFLERYALPAELVAGKSTVSVRFQSGEGWDAATANVFGCALVPSEK
ncbi:MAG: glycoside hydrolase family 127 protein [Nibricoccus sp.]